MTDRWTTRGPAQTRALGKRLGATLAPGDTVALCGDLGSGKTTFVQGVALGLGVAEAVTSPTFVLVREYRGRLPLYHVDLFRLDHIEDLEMVGYDEFVSGRGVTLIEWAQKMRERLPGDYVEVTFAVTGQTARTVVAIPHGPRAEQLVRQWHTPR